MIKELKVGCAVCVIGSLWCGHIRKTLLTLLLKRLVVRLRALYQHIRCEYNKRFILKRK